jgi:hypothetical protein
MAACDYAWIIEVWEPSKQDKEGAKAKTAFTWTEAARSAFATLKHLFTAAPILVHFHPEKPMVVETAHRKFRRPRGSIRWHITRGNSSHYDAHNKELLAVVTAFKEWEHMLKSVAGEITAYTDHQNCSNFGYHKSLDHAAGALVRAPRRVQL